MANAKMTAFFNTMAAQGLMLTYDDVRLRTHHSNVLPTEAKVDTMFSRRVKLLIPIASSPMDTVTTAPMAIAMAEAGGIGIIHRGLSPEAQAKEVARVKNRLHGKIQTPITVRDDETIAQVLRRREEKKFAFHTFPVVNAEGMLVGLLSHNDFDFCPNTSLLVNEIMTPLAKLLTATPDTPVRKAYQLMMKRRKKTLPLIRDDKLDGMYLFSDVKRIVSDDPGYNLDKNGQLIVGAAVGAGEGALIRANLLVPKGCDVLHIDTAHGDSQNILDTLHALKERYPDVDVTAGNVSSGESAKRLAEKGADAVFVGQGPGSICTTRVIAGVGVPQVSAVYECSKALEGSGVPVCADGGINNSGDIVIALAVGAQSVMLGRLLAGTEEAPGETAHFQGRLVKNYRGMGSLGAMRDSASSRQRYGQGALAISKVVPEGVEGIVDYRGSVAAVLEQYVGGIRSGLGYNGASNLADLREKAELFRITSSGLTESHPHDVTITAEAPNYQGRS